MKRILTILAIIAALLPTIALASPSRPGDRGETGGSTRVLTIKKQSRDMTIESADESKRIAHGDQKRNAIEENTLYDLNAI